VILIEGAVREIAPAIGEQLHRQTGPFRHGRSLPGGAGRGHAGRSAAAVDVRLCHSADPQPAAIARFRILNIMP